MAKVEKQASGRMIDTSSFLYLNPALEKIDIKLSQNNPIYRLGAV
jgi:hypothetical protein